MGETRWLVKPVPQPNHVESISNCCATSSRKANDSLSRANDQQSRDSSDSKHRTRAIAISRQASQEYTKIPEKQTWGAQKSPPC
jgi:hypothetical protein